MKTKIQNKKYSRPFHLHIEHFFRERYCLYIVLCLLFLATIKSGGRVVGIVRQTYTDGFGLVGQYMREETTRVPVTFDIAGRLPTVSGK